MRKAFAATLASFLLLGPAVAQDTPRPAPLNPGVTTAEILATAPVHWVSVPQIAASLEGKPPMVVGFDLDDTVWFSSACFYYGQTKYSPGSDDYLTNMDFWREANGGCDQYSIPKEVARSLLAMHEARGDTIYFITGRTRTENEKVTEQVQRKFNLRTINPVVFTASSENKTSFMRDHKLAIYYGDADSDVRSALEVGARPIRVMRAQNSTYRPAPRNGRFGEEVIINSTE